MTILIALAGLLVWATVFAFVISLCRAAALGDAPAHTDAEEANA